MEGFLGQNHFELPTSSGTYVVLLCLNETLNIRTGRLGTFDYPAGFFTYVGSAFGPGGLAARLWRHLSGNVQRPHWHIDYLRRQATPVQLWLSAGTERLEHDWAGILQRLPGATLPAPRFGASDCRCPAHLFHFKDHPDYQEFIFTMRKVVGRDVLVQQYLLK